MFHLFLAAGKTDSPLFNALVAACVAVVFELIFLPAQIARSLKRRKKLKEICCKCKHCRCEYNEKGELKKHYCALERDFKLADVCMNNGFQPRKTPLPIGLRNQTSTRKYAVITTVVGAVLIVLSLIFMPVMRDAYLKAVKEEATLILTSGAKAFESGSINKKYPVYLVDGYLFQFVGDEVRCYECNWDNNYYTTKAAILNYFDDVREEKPSPAMVLGGWFVADVVLCVLAVGAAAGLWIRWYYLHRYEHGKINNNQVNRQTADGEPNHESDEN